MALGLGSTVYARGDADATNAGAAALSALAGPVSEYLFAEPLRVGKVIDHLLPGRSLLVSYRTLARIFKYAGNPARPGDGISQAGSLPN